MGLFLRRKSKVSPEVVVAADLGEESAIEQISVAFKNGMTDEEYNKLRKKVYYPLALNGDANAQYWMGLLSLWCDKNAKDSLYWYEKSANQGNTEAMRALALGYSEYANDPSCNPSGSVAFGFDSSKEIYWKTKAAESGDYKAQVDLAFDCKIENKYDQAIYWYSQALQALDCKIIAKAYVGLAEIYGDIINDKYYNLEKQKECLVCALELRRRKGGDILKYSEDEYQSAAFSLGAIYLREYEQKKDVVMSKRCAYCFSLSYVWGNDYAKEWIQKSNYHILEQEWVQWVSHARAFDFQLPI